MGTAVAEVILSISGVYLAIGAVVGIAFVTRGVSVVDPAAAGAPVSFRLLILPGTVMLWPLVVLWWARTPRSGRRA